MKVIIEIEHNEAEPLRKAVDNFETDSDVKVTVFQESDNWKWNRPNINMELKELKNKIIGKELKTIITLEPTDHIRNIIKTITGAYAETLDCVMLLVFDEDIQLLYSDFDCDGYRSGTWDLSLLSDVLDKNATKEIKNINSIIRDIQYFESKDNSDFFMFTTDEYVITMGQNNVDDYYPSNFFSIEEAKEKAILDKKLVSGECIEKKS